MTCTTCHRTTTSTDRHGNPICGVCRAYSEAFDGLDRVHRVDGRWCPGCDRVFTRDPICATCTVDRYRTREGQRHA
jgi:hypothetical protein